MSDEAERAWERYEKERERESSWFIHGYVEAKEAFLSGFEAGLEAGRDLRDADLDERWKPPSPEDR